MPVAAIAIVVWAIFAAPVDTPVVGSLRYNCTLAASKTSVSVTVRDRFPAGNASGSRIRPTSCPCTWSQPIRHRRNRSSAHLRQAEPR